MTETATRRQVARRSALPTVSVIVPVWNVEPYLAECLDSIVGQTIGMDRLELIAVDDGSTDASGRMLDDYAARHPQMTVLHEPNSGGPGRPRNLGLDRATGTYVFFVDADDYLGLEALERLVAMAERNASDIVLGRIIGIEGRKSNRELTAFRRNADRVDPELVYRSANIQKLFRRSLLEHAHLRFPEGIPGGEDGDFMARGYLEAKTISIVADYACYYLRRRPGSQTLRKDRTDDLGDYIERVERDRIRVVAERRRAGPGRDILMLRHIRKIAAKFGKRWRGLPPEERRRVFDVGAGVMQRWDTPLIRRALPAWAALRVYCLKHGLLAELEDVVAFPAAAAYDEPFVEGGRAYARLPHFRDASGIPDRCFDITRELWLEQRLRRATVDGDVLRLSGEAHVALLGGRTTIELRRWPNGRVVRIPADPVATPLLRDRLRTYPASGFDAAIDLSVAAGGRPLPAGAWAIRLDVGSSAIHRAAPLLAPRRWEGTLDRPRGRDAGARAAVYRTPTRELRLRVGRQRPAAVWLERVESSATTLRLRAERVLTRTRPGRLLEMAVDHAARRAWRVR